MRRLIVGCLIVPLACSPDVPVPVAQGRSIAADSTGPSAPSVAAELARLTPLLDMLDGGEVVDEGRAALDQGKVPYLTDADVAFLKAHADSVRGPLLRRLEAGRHGTAYAIAAIGATDLTAPLARKLLAERSFYGWEGGDPAQSSTWLADVQYPRQMAYIGAIEHLNKRPWTEVVHPTPAELRALHRDALGVTNPAQPDTPTESFAAVWLLGKLGIPRLGHLEQLGSPRHSASQALANAAILLANEAIGGVRKGMTQKEIVALLGPQSHRRGRAWHWRRWELGVLFGDSKPGKVIGIVAQQPTPLKTTRGIGIGSSVEAVDTAYAAGRVEDPDYYRIGDERGLAFSVGDDGGVDAIYWGESWD